MSTDKTPAIPATSTISKLATGAKTALSLLAGVNGEVTLALNVAGVLVPLVKGAISEIRQIATGGQTMSFAVLIQTDDAELDAVDKLSNDDLTAVNAELARLASKGLPPS
jgi:hypothetical protein